MTVDRYVDEVCPRERIAWERMKSELTEANERCVRLRHERDELRAQLDTAAERYGRALLDIERLRRHNQILVADLEALRVLRGTARALRTHWGDPDRFQEAEMDFFAALGRLDRINS